MIKLDLIQIVEF